MLQMFWNLSKSRDERGASAVEYGLLVAAIAAIIVALVFGIGRFVQSGFNTTCTTMDAEMAATAPADADCA